MLVEFMQTQDKRSAHQERCIGDMSKQLGKLAKAVETLCGALGPAMRDSINGTLGPQMSDLRDIAAETRRAASDLNAAAAVARTQPLPPRRTTRRNSTPRARRSGARAAGRARRRRRAPRRRAPRDGAGARDRAHRRGGYRAGNVHRGRWGWLPVARPRDAEEVQGDEGADDGGAARRAKGAGARLGSRDSPRGASRQDEDRESDRRQRAREEREAREREAREKDEDARTREAREKDAKVRRRAASGVAERGAKAPAVNSRALSEDETKKIHSAIRWNKPLGELASLVTDAERANCEDPRNGNRPIHIAAQNGFTPGKLLVAKGAEIDAVNAKGNTGLHMALGYDYDECADVW